MTYLKRFKAIAALAFAAFVAIPAASALAQQPSARDFYDLVPSNSDYHLKRSMALAPYNHYHKAPHSGFDFHGNGVNPPIGPIAD